MNYEQEEFFALVEAVEYQGGELLDELCKSRKYTFTGDKAKPITLAGCGNQSLFRVPYEAYGIRLDEEGSELVEAGLHPVVVCAVDDDMGRWPRFGGDRFGREG